MPLTSCQVEIILNSSIPSLYSQKDMDKERIWLIQREKLKSELEQIEEDFDDDEFKELCLEISNAYMKSFPVPGEHIGILAAQSIGEKLTQTSLNTFHYTGLVVDSMSSGLPRLDKILNCSRGAVEHAVLEFINNPSYRQIIHTFIPCIQQCLVSDVCSVHIRTKTNQIVLKSNPFEMFKRKMWIGRVAKAINEYFLETYEPTAFEISVTSNRIGIIYIRPLSPIFTVSSSQLKDIIVSGIRNITRAVPLRYQDERWVLNVTIGSLKKGQSSSASAAQSLHNVYRRILSHEMVDEHKSKLDNPLTVFCLLGVEAACSMFLEELETILPEVGRSHLQLVSDTMFRDGNISAYNRYSFRHSNITTMSKCAFEESLYHFIAAATTSSRESITDLTNSIFFSRKMRYGTGVCDALLDTSKLMPHEFDHL